MSAALICARCGAPLPLEAAASPIAQCAYCEATLVVQGAAVSVAGTSRPAPQSSGITPSQAFTQEVSAAIAGGSEPYAVLRASAARHLGVAGQSDAVARVTLGLAADFDRENGTDATHDGMALSRIAEAYLKAVGVLAHAASTEINLPFLVAGARGPVHFTRTIEAATIARLAAADPTKKRGWWPF